MTRGFIFLMELFPFLSVTTCWKKLGRKKESTGSYSPDYPGKKYDLLKAIALAVRQCERLHILSSILAQSPILYLSARFQ